MLHFDERDDAVSENFDLLREMLLSNLFFFFRYSFHRMTGAPAIIPQPPGRKNHIKLTCDALEQAIRGNILQLNINFPPRYGKTIMADAGIAWCYAHEPCANWIYGSHGKTLATEQTEYIRQILSSRWYQRFFDVRISKTSGAKDKFKTTKGGQIIAIGADGTGIGFGAGLKGKRFGGGIMLDDMLKTEEAHSAAKTARFARVFSLNIVNRRNDPNLTPIIINSQRLSQNDPTAQLLGENGNRPVDVYSEDWRKNSLVIPAMDEAGNPLWPEMHDKKYLDELKRVDEFTYHAVFQQNPISSANRVFKTEFINRLKVEPNFAATFITGDTAETEKLANDATAFSFWGVYEIELGGQKTGMLGLHSILTIEIRVEPEDLEDEFDNFYLHCLRSKVKPKFSFIEKKSTGVTLISRMRNKPGLSVIEIPRNADSGSKMTRLMRSAPFMAKGQISICKNALHYERFINHFDQITFDGSYKSDDIADTYSDATQIALIDKFIYNPEEENSSTSVNNIIESNRRRRQALSG